MSALKNQLVEAMEYAWKAGVANGGADKATRLCAWSDLADQYLVGFELVANPKNDLTIRELQTRLPWSVRYSTDFRSSPVTHKDFAHALTHIVKAAGALAAFVDDMDHDRSVADGRALELTYGKYIADMVICALRLANTMPGGVLDLQRAVQQRIESKNDVSLEHHNV